MDLIDAISRLSARLPQQLQMLTTEEATKNALVMPVINALGYNVFDPSEFVPEFTADVGIKKGEKVDYAIMIEGKPMILIECKMVGTPLDSKHASQLYRYFHTTEARFGVLTNGIEFWFYTDIDAPNKMDAKPFFEFSMLDVNDRTVGELKKFSRATFNLDNILSDASELKYLKQLKRCIGDEFDSPSEELVRLLTARVYDGQFRSSVKEQFTGLVSRAFKEFIRDRLNSRLKHALDGTSASVDEGPAKSEAAEAGSGQSDESADGVMTTAEELEAYHIVRAILARDVDPARVVMRDTKSYCGILLDDNNRKPICRLRFNFAQKYIALLDAEKNEERIAIDLLTDIYTHADMLLQAVHRYDGTSSRPPEQPSKGNGEHVQKLEAHGQSPGSLASS
ncbi:MAG: type I restriction endonuclease [Planctomycetota bacterium]